MVIEKVPWSDLQASFWKWMSTAADELNVHYASLKHAVHSGETGSIPLHENLLVMAVALVLPIILYIAVYGRSLKTSSKSKSAERLSKTEKKEKLKKVKAAKASKATKALKDKKEKKEKKSKESASSSPKRKATKDSLESMSSPRVLRPRNTK